MEPIIREFRTRALSGSVAIVLHFFRGDVGMLERLVGAKKALGSGPPRGAHFVTAFFNSRSTR